MAHIRKVVVPVVVVFIALVLLTTTVLATSPYVGKWSAIDDVDGSQMRLIIKPWGAKYIFQFHDHRASVCGLDDKGNPLYPAIGYGFGGVGGRGFNGAMQLYCTQELIFNGAYQFDATYNPENDTLLDNNGEVWTRIN